VYGVTAVPGVVTKVSHDEGARGDTPACTVEVFVQDRGSDTWTLWAPSAQTLGYEDGDLRISDNWMGLPTDGWLDAQGFVEPSWSSFGGTVYVKVIQWDGSWSETLTAELDDVTAVAGASTLHLTNVSGAYVPHTPGFVVFREKTQQDAGSWADELLGVLCDEDGEYTAGELGPTWMV
jgi:hypothetical protein